MKKLLIFGFILAAMAIQAQTYNYKNNFAVDFDNSPQSNNHWYLDVIEAQQAWEITLGSPEIPIAYICASGVNWLHEDLGDNGDGFDNIHRTGPGDDEEWEDWDDPNDNVTDDDQNGYVDDWRGIINLGEPQGTTNNTLIQNLNVYHSTWIAGIISAKNIDNIGINGIAGGGQSTMGNSLMISGYDYYEHIWEDISSSISYALDNGAKVILLDALVSKTISAFGNIDEVLETAFETGCFVVAPSGLDGGSTLYFPSSYGNYEYNGNIYSVFSVGASTEPDSQGDEYRHSLSNYGMGNILPPGQPTNTELDLVAPGEHLYTTSDITDEYRYIKGTAPAAAMVAATVGLMLSVNPDLTYLEIENILHETADKINNQDNGGDYNYNWNAQYPGHSLECGYGRLNTYRAVCEALSSAPPLEVNDGDIWVDPKFSLNNIEIQTDYTLTIKSTVSMGPDAKIIVHPGAKLILDGGTLTNYKFCGYENTLWPGVEVWGTSNESQYPCNGDPNQGTIEIKNEGVIENARIGVLLGAKEGENFISSKTGGMIWVRDSRDNQQPGASFLNNERAVFFYTYNNFIANPPNCFIGSPAFNRSYLLNCHFEVDADYFEGTWNASHIYMLEVNGINIKGCTFVNNNSAGPKGHGINAWGAGFTVDAICRSAQAPCPEIYLDKCTFANFKKGVNLITAGTRTITVKNAAFFDNSIGIQLSDVNNASILFSDFYLGEPLVCDLQNKTAFGIDMNSCTGFAIEENYFTKATGAPPLGDYVGILIAETQSTDQVYNNTFTYLSFGNYAVGENWGGDFFNGLAYYCNDNTTNFADFYVEPDNDILKISGIQSKQGDDDYVAGNKFTPSGATWHFYNGGDYLVGYYFCDYCSNENPDDFKEFQVTDKPKGFDNDCPSHYGGGGGGGIGRGLVLTPGEKQETEMEFATNLADYNNVKTLYDNLKDGGNTEATITDIETAWPNDMWELRAELLGKSPHLSMEVLKATADKTDVLPDNVIFEIMAANPDELKKEELIKYLEDKVNPLPEYMVNILRQVAEGSTYKTVLEQEMAHFNQLKTRAAYDIIRSNLNDSVTNMAELRNWLDNVGGKRADEQIIASYIAENNYTDALALANMMPTLYEFSVYELVEHNYYIDMLNLQIQLLQEGRTVYELDSTEVNNLVTVAETSSGTASTQAKGILEFAYGYQYCNCLNVSDSAGFKSSGIINQEDYAKAYGVEIITEPNPASEWVAFNYTLPDNTSEGVIKVVDAKGTFITSFTVSGQHGQKVWDTRNIKPGVYFYTLNASEFNRSGKIVISK